MRWRLAVGGLLAVLLLGALAEPAAANHVVIWGAGTTCDSASKTASTTVNKPVSFIVCVTLGGEPLAGHRMDIQVAGPTRSVTSSLTTGDDGIAHWAVQPTAPGDTRVTLCDADGCVYGSTVITATPAPTTTTTAATTTTTTTRAAPPPVAAVSTTTTASTTTTTTTTTTTVLASAPQAGSGGETSDGGGGGSKLLLVLLGVLVLVAGALLLWLRLRTTQLAGGPPIATAPRSEPQVRPVIFVPGIMATALHIKLPNGRYTPVWPPFGFDGDAGKSLEALQVGANASFEIDQSTGHGMLPTLHKELISTLNAHGYQNLTNPRNLYIHSYNWMDSCAVAGAKLATLIQVAKREHGVAPSIVCHSMGGLVTRAAWHLHGARDIDRVIYIGSPHFGASMAYFVLHPDIPYSFLGGFAGRVLNAGFAMDTVIHSESHTPNRVREIGTFLRLLASNSAEFDNMLKLLAQNSTGVFELLPDRLYFEHANPEFHLATERWREQETQLAADVDEMRSYVPGTWEQLYLGTSHLRLPTPLHPKVRAAMQFKDSIARPLPPEDGDRTMIIYGLRQPTNSSVTMVTDHDEVQSVVLSGEQGGDGTVPSKSGQGKAIWAGDPRVEVENAAEHFMLTETDAVQELVRTFLPPGGMAPP